jgi:hypothetical protein
MPVNIEKARAFTAALRSDEYRQTLGELKTWRNKDGYEWSGDWDNIPDTYTECYCAEGVFALVVLDAEFDRFVPVIEFNGEVRREAGYLSGDLITHVFGEYVNLHDLNDSGKSFAEIADYLEALFPEIKA